MKKLFVLSIALLIGISLQAQLTSHQIGNEKTAAEFAESPQIFLDGSRQLRGFGCFLSVNKKHERYDNLAGFYETGKDGDNFLIFFVTAEVVNKSGKVVGKSNTIKAKIIPGKTYYPSKLAFPGDLFDELDGGAYELRISVSPANKELKEFYRIGKPKVQFRFEK